MATQRNVLEARDAQMCAVWAGSARRALDLLHFLVAEQETRFGQLDGLPRQQ